MVNGTPPFFKDLTQHIESWKTAINIYVDQLSRNASPEAFRASVVDTNASHEPDLKKYLLIDSSSGYINEKIVGDYINVVLADYQSTIEPRMDRPRPPLLWVVDNLRAHMTQDVFQACQQRNISVLFLPPNTPHKNQVLDVAFNHTYK